MILTKSLSKFIGTRAFSTLSTLSTYASSNEEVLLRIVEDMKMEPGQPSLEYLNFITARLEKQKNDFVAKYYEENVEERYNGLFSLISIAKDPSNKIFSECSKRCVSLTKTTNEDGLNQVYFLNVFSALKNSTEEDVLQDLISTLSEVSTYASENREKIKFSLDEIINPNTILWLLKIIVKYRAKKKLCLSASMTLLNLVSSHEIAFDYQEDAIIKMFNAALQNLEYEGSTDGEDDGITGSDKKINYNGLLPNDEKKQAKSTKNILDKHGHSQEKDSSSEGSGLVPKLKPDAKPRKTVSKFNKKNTSVLLKMGAMVDHEKEKSLSESDIEEEKLSEDVLPQVIEASKHEKKSSSNHIGKVLGRNKADEAEMTEDELMEVKIIDCLYKAFTHESSHHLLFNEDLIQIALYCLECCQDISIDVKRKLAKLISISTLIQERLLKEEIIEGIKHMLDHKDEPEMLRHTIIACSHLSMNYAFSSSPLSNEIMKKLVPLIPIFEDKDLYVLLVTISKIMQGRDDNKTIFISAKENYLGILLDKVINTQCKKDLALAVSLVLKELFAHSDIQEMLQENAEITTNIEKFLILLSTKISFPFEEINAKIKNAGSKKKSASVLSEYKGRSEILGFEIDLINKEYEPLNTYEILASKIDPIQIEKITMERTLCMYLKNECYFLIGKWLKLNPDSSNPKIFDIYIDLFFSLISSATQELEVIELMNSLTNSDILTLNQNFMSDLEDDQEVKEHDMTPKLNTPQSHENHSRIEKFIRNSLSLLKSQKSLQKDLKASIDSNPAEETKDPHTLKSPYTDIIWIISAIFELNYGTAITKLYQKLGVGEFLLSLPEYQDYDPQNYSNFNFSANLGDLDDIDEEEYDEQIRVLKAKLDACDESDALSPGGGLLEGIMDNPMGDLESMLPDEISNQNSDDQMKSKVYHIIHHLEHA